MTSDIPRKDDGTPDFQALVDECGAELKTYAWPWERIYSAGRRSMQEDAAKVSDAYRTRWGDIIAIAIRKLK